MWLRTFPQTVTKYFRRHISITVMFFKTIFFFSFALLQNNCSQTDSEALSVRSVLGRNCPAVGPEKASRDGVTGPPRLTRHHAGRTSALQSAHRASPTGKHKDTPPPMSPLLWEKASVFGNNQDRKSPLCSPPAGIPDTGLVQSRPPASPSEGKTAPRKLNIPPWARSGPVKVQGRAFGVSIKTKHTFAPGKVPLANRRRHAPVGWGV